MITENFIGFERSAQGENTYSAVNPVTQETLPGAFVAATMEEVNLAVNKAHEAWKVYRNTSGAQKATFLRTIAEEIEGLGDTLVNRVMEESGLPEGRVKGERGRTCNQLRMFADLVEEGSWVNAIIDTAQPDRQPIPKADIRNMLQAVGPVVVFTASNFPLAFSTAGGDTASALASGCPVIVKAHESHPGTNGLIAEAILNAARKTKMPDGVFSSLNAIGYQVGTALVQHPQVKSVAFTGSYNGGMALHKLAADRTEPIPVFAEMGSVNPIFVLPGIIKTQSEALANQIAGSVNLGAGQFCTNPGLVVIRQDENTEAFMENLGSAFEKLAVQNMLNQGIYQNYERLKKESLQTAGVTTVADQSNDGENWEAYPAVASASAAEFLMNPNMQQEVFGPFSLVVQCEDEEHFYAVADHLHGQLTASIMGTQEELAGYADLFDTLQTKAGRVIFNGVPTGVEVCHAMQHGGPFPASTDGRFTSVGTGAIKRFARPVAFQDCPDAMLPAALQADNPMNILRLVDGNWVR
ncbi:MAG: aldehyde dehydrogenase (NADP(+)) [Bacteroidetes bacterium]|nr:MAG: aldehyde dehydrogenase (NADP(+)) [Bacteroidota bacterium]